MAVMFICTLPYKKTFRKQINRKRHKLCFFYGMAMFLADRLPKAIMNKNTLVNNAMKELSVKDNFKKDRYLYMVEKISICLLIFAIALIIGICVSLSEKDSVSVIKNLRRDASKSTTYEFNAQSENGEEETIIVDVNKKELRDRQIYEILEGMQDALVQKVLKDNKSADYVNKNLELITDFGKENVSIAWDISDSSIIGYDGTISDNIPEEGVIVDLTATMTLQDISQEYTFSVNVFPSIEAKSIQSQIQKYVNENNIYEDQVKLPDKINGEEINYYKKFSSFGKWIFPAGIVLAIALFFLKDKDLKGQLEKRDTQMLLDYPEIVSKVLLYYEAGLSIKSTFERIVSDYKKVKEEDKEIFRYAYEELELTLTKMKSGVSDIAAIKEYGARCGLHCYIKFAGIVEQNLKRGAREMSYALKTEVANAMMERKNAALKSGSRISTKLLGPMIIMLVISMAIIMVPAFMSMNF